MKKRGAPEDELLSEYNNLLSQLGGGPVDGPTSRNQVGVGLSYQSPVPNSSILSSHGVVTESHPDGHNGLDLKAPRGTPVYPIGSGIVHSVGVDPKGGNYVMTWHENGGVRAYYAHLESVSVQPNQSVNANTQIGTLGDSGNARGFPHLHYQVSIDGQWVDPKRINSKMVGALSKAQQRVAARKSALEKLAFRPWLPI